MIVLFNVHYFLFLLTIFIINNTKCIVASILVIGDYSKSINFDIYYIL